MDEVLTKAWKASARPFDGEALTCSDLLPLPLLHTLTVQVVKHLKERFAAKALLRFDDWHQHDGFISSTESSGWLDLEQILASKRSLYESRASDAFVRKAFYDTDRNFLLRLYVADENDDPQEYPGIWGDFDLTGPITLIREISTRLLGERESKLVVERAKDFFDRVHAG